MTEQNTDNNNLVSRDKIINAAVSFLKNKKIINTPYKKKELFLKSKGLTDEEIKQAFAIANIELSNSNQNEYTSIAIPNNYQNIYPQYYSPELYQPTILHKIQLYFNTAAFIGTTFYCVYWFYKKFIEPFLFGRKKIETINDKVTQLDKNVKTSVKEIKDSVVKIESSVKKLLLNVPTDPTVQNLIRELKQDLSSLKGLLLSRKQFPSAPASIPAWQIEAGVQSREKSREREDDAGSGSSTNNSDSSLEMIREDPPK